MTLYLDLSHIRVPSLRGEFVKWLDLVPTAWREEEHHEEADFAFYREEPFTLDQGGVLDQILVSVALPCVG